MKKNLSTEAPEVNFSEEGLVRHLHLGSIWIQGSMRVDAPTVLVHEYVQRMMAWMLLVDPATAPMRRALQLGLGAGSLSKFCALEVGMRSTAIELNPQVLHACRGWFALPADHPRLQVVLADAAQEICQPQWQGSVDALQVDLYDQDAAAPVLDSPDFYADCRSTLTSDGCMTVNLFGRSSSFARSVNSIAQAFGREAIWAFKATREGNTVVLAQRTATRPDSEVLKKRAAYIQEHWGLPALKWARAMQPV